MKRPRNIRDLPIMPGKCKTCPFGDDGDPTLRATIIARLLKVSQTCHSTGAINGKPDTHICRGARDWQNEMMFRMRIIDEPTDAAWTAKRKALKI